MEINFDPGLRVIVQIDSQYRVNLTEIFSNYSVSRVVFYFQQ